MRSFSSRIEGSGLISKGRAAMAEFHRVLKPNGNAVWTRADPPNPRGLSARFCTSADFLERHQLHDRIAISDLGSIATRSVTIVASGKRVAIIRRSKSRAL
jgi:hypothetical protein